MKLLLTALFIIGTYTVTAQQCKLTLEISYTGLEQGYNHVTKDEIYIAGVLVKTTDERRSSESMKLKIKIPRGSQRIEIVNWTLYKGTWEKTALENDYSIDGIYAGEHIFGKKAKITVLYDLDDMSRTPNVKFD